MALTALETNLLKALKDAEPFVKSAYDAGDLAALSINITVRDTITAAENKAKRRAAPTIKPGPRCKRTPDMFEKGGKR